MLLGIDIGGTKCAVILGKKVKTQRLEIIDKKIVKTDRPVLEMIELIFATVEKLLSENEVSLTKIDGIGISCGGPLSSKRGLILSPPNLIGWDNVPIVSLFEEKFGVKTIVQNDANACAMAEWKYGSGKGFENVVFLTFGTGMGAGLILNGKLYSGPSELAGEIGHIRLADKGPVGFGKEGSFEGFCSGGGIAQIAQVKARQRLQMGKSVTFCSSIEELPNINAKIVAEAAYKGDEDALDVYRISAEYLGRGISIIIDFLNPEVIIIGSIYGRAKELIEPHMNKIIAMESILASNKACKITSAGLAENIGDIAALNLADDISQKNIGQNNQHDMYQA